MWAETNQSIFFAENEQVAVTYNFVATTMTIHQQEWGKALTLGRVASYLPGFLSEAILQRVLAKKKLQGGRQRHVSLHDLH